MELSIEYCSAWNYLPQASSLESEIKQEFPNTEITLIPSGGGVFEIVLDGQLIFSKKALNRFPEEGEIVKKLNVWQVSRSSQS